MTLAPPETADLNALFKQLEFYSLLSEEAAGAAEKASEDADYGSCLSLEDLVSLLAALPRDRPVAVYPLIDAFIPVRGPLAGLAICAEPGHARWVPLAGQSGLGNGGIERLRAWLEDEERPKITHNAKNLRTTLLRVGVELQERAGARSLLPRDRFHFETRGDMLTSSRPARTIVLHSIRAAYGDPT